MTYKFNATIKDGLIRFDDPGQAAAFLASREGKFVTISFSGVELDRTLAQNSWYWGQIIPAIAEYTGYTKDETHEALKAKFLTVHKDNPLPKVISTKILTTIEFSEYCEEVRDFAAQELGIYIPSPKEV